MADGLIERANAPGHDPRRKHSQACFKRHSRSACLLLEGITGSTVAYMSSDLVEAAVSAGRTDELIEALVCARRLGFDEGYDAGGDHVRSGMRSLLGLPAVAMADRDT